MPSQINSHVPRIDHCYCPTNRSVYFSRYEILDFNLHSVKSYIRLRVNNIIFVSCGDGIVASMYGSGRTTLFLLSRASGAGKKHEKSNVRGRSYLHVIMCSMWGSGYQFLTANGSSASRLVPLETDPACLLLTDSYVYVLN